MKGRRTNPLTGARWFVEASQFDAFAVFATGDVEALPITIAGVPAFLAFLFDWERHDAILWSITWQTTNSWNRAANSKHHPRISNQWDNKSIKKKDNNREITYGSSLPVGQKVKLDVELNEENHSMRNSRWKQVTSSNGVNLETKCGPVDHY